MREQALSSPRRRRAILLVSGAASIAVLVATFGRVEATAPSRAEVLQTILESPAAYNRKLMAIEELRQLTTTNDARQRLETLADSSDDTVARMAISAIGRASYTGARTKLDGIYVDTARSDAARGAALAIVCSKESRAGSSWSSVRNWVRANAGTNTNLSSLADSLKARFWPNEAE
jgi:hypothetical protein